MNCWVLSTVRTGSSYYCELLNGTGLFKQKFKEKFPLYSSRQNMLEDMPSITKVHYAQFRRFFSEDDLNLISNRLPNIKYLFTKRNCLVCQAVSFCVAKKYKTFYIYNKNKADNWDKTKVVLTDQELLSAWGEIKLCQNKWNDYLKNVKHHTVAYEDLTSRPREVLKESLDYLGLRYEQSNIENSVVNCGIYKMTKPENAEYEERLKHLLKSKAFV